MPLTLQQIIEQADVRVPNVFTAADKVNWLNEVNKDFFDMVKIPLVHTFTTVTNQSDYPLPNDVRGKNISIVKIGNGLYSSLLTDAPIPSMNYWTFNDTNNTLTLTPTPYRPVESFVRYYRIGTTEFVSTVLSVNPDAPPEYHHIYTLGLCERMAKAMNDGALAANYANDYRGSLMVAQQNYIKE